MDGTLLEQIAMRDDLTAIDRAAIAALARPARPKAKPIVEPIHDPNDGARPFGWTLADEIEVMT